VIIRIKNLRLNGIIGVNPWEKTEPQPLTVSIDVEFDGSRAAITDKLEDTIDYSDLASRVIEHVNASRCELIETLAGNLLKLAMEDTRVKRARIEVEKTNAIRFADSTSVEVTAVRE
jgi:FolB domain-containing protein